jgi:hypothetical protein
MTVEVSNGYVRAVQKTEVAERGFWIHKRSSHRQLDFSVAVRNSRLAVNTAYRYPCSAIDSACIKIVSAQSIASPLSASPFFELDATTF